MFVLNFELEDAAAAVALLAEHVHDVELGEHALLEEELDAAALAAEADLLVLLDLGLLVRALHDLWLAHQVVVAAREDAHHVLALEVVLQFVQRADAQAARRLQHDPVVLLGLDDILAEFVLRDHDDVAFDQVLEHFLVHESYPAHGRPVREGVHVLEHEVPVQLEGHVEFVRILGLGPLDLGVGEQEFGRSRHSGGTPAASDSDTNHVGSDVLLHALECNFDT